MRYITGLTKDTLKFSKRIYRYSKYYQVRQRAHYIQLILSKNLFGQENILTLVARFWKTCLVTLAIALMGYCFGGQIPTAIASQEPTVINVSLGNEAGELKFFPEDLEFTAGQSYTLLLDNPSPIKHYFIAKDFADASWTKKVQAGKVEIKGAIHELELKPGGQAEWVLTPMKSGTYQLYCSIPGHKESGMIGEIVVK